MFARRQRATRTRERIVRLFLEPLEDRILLSLLGLAQQGAKPDITSGVINDLSYTQRGNNANPFHYDSVPLWITLPNGSVDYISNPSGGGNSVTNLDLVLSNNGYLVPGSGNAFRVTGHVTVGGNTYDGTLLTAQPQAFGYGDSFSSAQGEFEVKLQITGGQLAAPSDAAPDPYRVGDELALLIHQPGLPITHFPQTFSFSTLPTGAFEGRPNTRFPWTFSMPETGVFEGSSDTLNVPAVPPATAPGTSCGCGGCPPVGNNLAQPNTSAGGNVQQNTSAAPVNYFDGVAQISAGNTNLSSGGFDPWGQNVNWSNGPGYAAHGVNGNGIVDTTMPYLLPVNGPNAIAEVANGATAEYFDLVNGAYRPSFFDQSTLVYNTSTNQYVLTDEMGDRLRFWGFSPAIPLAQQGQFVSFTDPGGNVTSVTAYTPGGKIAEVQRGTTTGGTTVTESWLYSYITSGVNAGLLQNVTLERQTNGGPAEVVRQAVYTYYDGDQSYGLPGDLMLAQVENAAGQVIDTSYFRYYTEADAGTTGYIQGLKYYFSTDSYARLVAAVGNPLTATDAQVAPYADNYFEYDSQMRVSKEVAQGLGCSSCSGGLGTFTFSYTQSNNPAGYNSWAVKTVETLPDGNENIVYSNFAGEQMLGVFEDTATGQQWDTFYQYDNQGRVILQANPSAVTGYNDGYADLLHNQNGHYQYLSDHSGLITLYDYASTTTATESAPGRVAGYQQDSKIEQGQLGTPILQESMQYFAHTANGISVDPLATDTVYRNTNGSGAETTRYGYTWYANSVQMQSMTTTLPVISAAQNGPGVADQSVSVFDKYGRDIWDKDADGYINYTAYDPGTGAAVKSILDVNTAVTGEFSNLPSGWSTPAGGGLNLVTTDQVDDLGRTVKETSPNGNVTYTVYDDPNHEVRVYRGWNAATGMPSGPTEVYRQDLPGSYIETLTMSATPHLTNGVPDGTEAISNIQTLTRDYMNAAGQVVRTDDYFNLSGVNYSTAKYIGTQSVNNGTQNGNYYTTLFAYDDRGRLDRTVSPTGTSTRTIYDGLDRVVSIWAGTNDTPASGFWSPTNNTDPANMVETTAYVYDNGGTGDSNLTAEIDFPGGGAAPRLMHYFYDWRDRQVAEKDGEQASENDGTNRPIYYTTYDNLNESIAQAMYTADGVTIQTVNGVPQAPDARLLRAYSTTEYDDQGRVYQANTYDVNPLTGAVSTSSLTTNYYYDHRGDQIAESDPGGLWTKDVYDGTGRLVTEYTTDGGSGTSWAAAGTVVRDVVLEQVQTVYDADSNPIETIDTQRYPNTAGTGPLHVKGAGPLGRAYYRATYYDLVDRPVADVNVGTNGGTAWMRPSFVPARSDTVLVTSYGYSPAGFQNTTEDPKGLVDQKTFDALGRVSQDVQDYTNGIPTNSSNQTTKYTYNGKDNVLTVTAVQPAGTPSQTTQYVYGVTTASGSAINSNDLLSTTLYPDPTTGLPSTSQKERYTYNALGQITSMTDRNGNVHQYAYDVLGRHTSDSVTTLGAGVDGSVRRIDTAYDQQGNPYLFTSYADTAGTQVVNQVLRQFNGLGQLIAEYQSASGPVNLSSTPSVKYAYMEMASGQNNSRLISMTYPNGRVLNYNYNAGLDSRISRLSSISDMSGILEAYKYLGLGTVVERDHPQTGIEETFLSQNGSTGDAGDQITGLDRFGRIIEDAWFNTQSKTYTDDFTYTYDRDSNVLSKNNTLKTSFNETYTYNGLNELTGYSQANGQSESYGLDALGNMTRVTTNGSIQTRTANAQNEYTSVSGGATPTYDNNGNLTTIPTTGNKFTYDAWNRLAKVTGSDGTPLASYQYDAAGRRVLQTENGTSTALYYNSQWQVIEERVGNKATAQNVWSPAGVDRLVCRDTNPNSNGTLTKRVYVQQDIVGNVTAAVIASGTVVARYVETPYGQQSCYDASWNLLNGNPIDLPYGFQGYRTDVSMGLDDARTRVYVVSMQRFAQNDRTGFAGGTSNFYVLEGNNPTSRTDPFGLRWTLGDVALGAAWGALGALTVVAVVATAPVSVPTLLIAGGLGAAAGGYAAGQFARNQNEAALYGFGGGVTVAAAPYVASRALPAAAAALSNPQNVERVRHLFSRAIFRNIFSASTQTEKLDKCLVQQYKHDMLNNLWRWRSVEGRIGGYFHNGNYYITEGHKRMEAAMQIYEETGDRSFVDKLLQLGEWTYQKPPIQKPLPGV
jgi:RHS repeat-associated protein